ncbi:hypothetical protein [Chondromyces apiculatus]|uniref:Uncharacterized protein n=1 Tax=Chondromyces apiculatus DSM 436 TaxID=1192034 RepID=A0A017TEK4_9BACT|nr:hypothetical protein [Chondromyces apiculatus]EYF07723.1 Hypothetical protein CAP_8224 [Chondromyces apiculatus DSM 436]
MIHADSGEIDLAPHLRVGARTAEGTFLRSHLAARAKALTLSPGWSAYRLDRLNLFGRSFRVTLRFHQGWLVAVELYQVGAVSKMSWDDWSHQEENARKADHDTWLDALLGPPPYAYAWGSIRSEHDPLGGYSQIVIRYGAEQAA